jgi:hypothetical protein
MSGQELTTGNHFQELEEPRSHPIALPYLDIFGPVHVMTILSITCQCSAIDARVVLGEVTVVVVN